MIRLLILSIVTPLIYACNNSTNSNSANDSSSKGIRKHVEALDELISTSQVAGTILIFNPENTTYYSNNFKWADSSFLPASTFKIPNSIIALETKLINNDTTIIPWDGNQRRFKVWEQDLTFRNAFHYSCVPCYQDIARRVGVNKMKQNLELLNFGRMSVDTSNIDSFWLEGTSNISPFEQIDFLQRLNTSQLSISDRTESMMKQMMIITENDSIVIRGKTGWSNSNSINNGWFVGYIEKGNTLLYFATNIEPDKTLPLKQFAELRRSLTYQALNIINK